MRNFKHGQELVCTSNDWMCEECYKWTGCYRVCGPAPKKDDIVTCEGYDPADPGCIYLKEYPQIDIHGCRACYDEQSFEPLVSLTAEIEEALTLTQPEYV